MAGAIVPWRLFSVHVHDAAVRVRLQSLSGGRQGVPAVRGLSCPGPVSAPWRASRVGHSREGHSAYLTAKSGVCREGKDGVSRCRVTLGSSTLNDTVGEFPFSRNPGRMRAIFTTFV